jgi:hypothetical protein
LCKTILQGKANSELSLSGIDDILVSHVPEMEKMPRSQFDQKQPSHKSLRCLKWFYATSCDGVTLKFKKKNGRASVH